MAPSPGNRLHRLSRVNYPARALGFLASFVMILLLALERDWPWTALIFPALFLLVYPHALVLLLRYRRTGKQAETRAMLLDAFALGAMVAWMQFFIWLSFPLVTATLLNNAVLGGLRLFLRAVALFAVGVAAGGAVKGWQVSRNGPALIEVISMAVLLGYTLMVAFLAYDQNMRLVTSAREIEERSRIFQALVEISTSADLASEVDDFINEALERVHRHYPRNGLGLVVRQANRNTAFRFASFVGIDQHQQEQLFQVLADTPAPKDDFHNRIELSEGTFHFLFMRGQIRGHEGLIVVRAEHIRRLLYESMGLFLEVLAATIENKRMAMELKNAAERDSLTGVFNRGYRDTELAHAIRNRRQHPSMEFSVVLLDVIGLKAINDTRGHLAGDAYIQGTAEALG